MEIQNHFKNVELKTIENAGHWLHAEKPEAFLTFVNQFLMHSTPN
jgi:pimeloyl-ACP methyl ester carboxylesterase